MIHSGPRNELEAAQLAQIIARSMTGIEHGLRPMSVQF